MSVAEPTAPPTPAVATGHPIGFWFFFWGEFAERCSYYGMRAILALYMTEKLGVAKDDAGTFMSLFIAACYFFPLIGGWVADNFLGKYWTIVLFSVPYVVAQFLVGIENQYVVGGTLLLLAMGSGVIKPNISTLMGLTYDQQRPGQEKLRTSAFSWFYMAINIGAALSQFTMPWLRTTYGYQVAFLFPAGLMALALVIFALGKKFYAQEKIERKVVGENSSDRPADSKTITGIPVTYTVVTAEEKAADTKLKWQTLGRIGAVFLTVMFFWAIFDQAASTWIFFANTYMDTTLIGERLDGSTLLLSGDTVKSMTGNRSWGMSADAIQGFNPLFIILFVPVSVAVFKVLKIKATTKMIVGFVLTGLAMVIVAYSGTLAGKAEKVVRLTTPDGILVVTKPETSLDQMKAGVGFGDGVRVVADNPEYNDTSKSVSFTSGKLLLTDGQEVVVKDGHPQVVTAADKSTDLTAGGVLESTLKPPAEDAKPGKVTVEVIDWTKPNERVTVWWQVFAYLILTIAEILISVTGLELAFVAAPPSMKSFVTACWLAVVFLANLLINAPITRLYPLMAPGLYFALLAGAMAVVVVVFVPIAMMFNKAMSAKEAAEKAAAEGKTEAV